MTSAARIGVLFLACFVIGSSVASAQATRTWVSGVGDDANPCSRTAPCKTFAGAISKTAAGGEIDVLDPGGYGAVTITKNMTITGIGTSAGVLVTGSPGIVVNGAGISVILRNLNLDGIAKSSASAGTYGVRVVNGASLLIDNSTIADFERGVSIESGNALVKDSVISGNTIVGGTVSAGSLTFQNSTFVDNQVAVQASGGGVLRLSNNDFYNNRAAFGCGGVIASAGNNRKANNVGGSDPVCAPTATINVQ